MAVEFGTSGHAELVLCLNSEAACPLERALIAPERREVTGSTPVPTTGKPISFYRRLARVLTVVVGVVSSGGTVAAVPPTALASRESGSRCLRGIGSRDRVNLVVTAA